MPDRSGNRPPNPRASARRLLGPGLAALAAIAILAASALSSDDGHRRLQPPASAPNIVVIVTDDQTLSQFSAETMPATHRLLAERGTTFTDFIVTTPLCCPSRATLLTGQYAHNNGVTSNSYKRLRDKRNVLPVWLQRAGYRTAHVGKYLNGYEKTLDDSAGVPPGWDQWFTQLEPQRYYNYELSENGARVEYGDRPEDYLTRVLNRHAAATAERYAANGRAFYLQVDHYAPHFSPGGSERACQGAATPDPEDRELAAADAEPPAAGRQDDPADVARKPRALRELPPLRAGERERIAEHWRCALASLRAVDRGVEQLVEVLKRHGELERTAFIFTSDNGYFYGEHRIRAKKEFPYEEAIRAPLVIRPPERFRDGQRVERIDAPVANIDLAPTILGFAGADPCPGDGACRELDGRSLVPALRGKERLPRDRALVIELDQDPSSPRAYARPCSYVGVRMLRRVLIRHSETARAGQTCRVEAAVEHYDLRADPEQTDNLAAGGRAAPERAMLKRKLRQLRTCAGAPDAVAIAAGDPGRRSRPACE